MIIDPSALSTLDFSRHGWDAKWSTVYKSNMLMPLCRLVAVYRPEVPMMMVPLVPDQHEPFEVFMLRARLRTKSIQDAIDRFMECGELPPSMPFHDEDEPSEIAE